MKKSVKLLSFLMCAVLLFGTVHTVFAFWDPFNKLAEKEGVEVKISAKKTVVREPPYYIMLEIPLAYTYHDFGYGYSTLKIEGTKPGISHQVEGEWEFTFYFEHYNEMNRFDYPGVVVVQPYHMKDVVTGQGKGIVTNTAGQVPEEFDPVKKEREEKAKKEEKRKKDLEDGKKKLREFLGLSPEERKKKAEEEKEKIKNPQPKTLYKASFTIQGNGVFTGGNGIINSYGVTAPWGDIDQDRNREGMIGYTIDLTIDDKDFVKASVKHTDNYGYSYDWPITGKFTCKKEIETKLKISAKFPVWGTWTDKDIYADVPTIIKDYEKRQRQIAAKEKDPSAKIDTVTYNNGKWFSLVKGSKTTPHTYEMTEITDQYILYEKGVMDQFFKLIPDVKYQFPRDHQDNSALYSKPLESYGQLLTSSKFDAKYNFRADTLMMKNGFFVGTELYRVRGSVCCETWSSVKDVEKPDPKTVRSTAGTWYEFKMASGAYTDGNGGKVYTPSEVGGLTFEKVVVNGNGTAEVLSGRAEIYAFDEYIKCYVEKRVKYDGGGKAATETYGDDVDEDDEEAEEYEYEELTIRYTDYNKSAGTIQLNGGTFYKVSKAALNGTWSTQESAPPLPDSSSEAARAAIKENYAVPVTWLKFSSPSREFSRLIWKPGEGLLLETGTYTTLGEGQVVLENIVGTFYRGDGSLDFEEEAKDGMSETLDYYEDFGGEFYISGVGRMYKTPK